MPWFRSACALAVLAIAPLLVSGCEAPSSSPPPASMPAPGGSSPSPSVTSAMPTANEPPSGLASEAEIWSQLRQGQGYVILFRHALAPGTGDPAHFQLDDCSTQRNLSAEGQQQAVRMGQVLKQQGITVSRVLSSQWCRCLDTARLMDVGPVEPFPVLNSFFQDRSTASSQTEQLRQFILENRDNPAVTILVTHQVNITALSAQVPQSGAAVVMQATAPDQVKFIGQFNPL